MLTTEEDFGGVKVQVCRDGCKGIWFDWGELAKLDEKNEGVRGPAGSPRLPACQRPEPRPNQLP